MMEVGFYPSAAPERIGKGLDWVAEQKSKKFDETRQNGNFFGAVISGCSVWMSDIQSADLRRPSLCI